MHSVHQVPGCREGEGARGAVGMRGGWAWVLSTAGAARAHQLPHRSISSRIRSICSSGASCAGAPRREMEHRASIVTEEPQSTFAVKLRVTGTPSNTLKASAMNLQQCQPRVSQCMIAACLKSSTRHVQSTGIVAKMRDLCATQAARVESTSSRHFFTLCFRACLKPALGCIWTGSKSCKGRETNWSSGTHSLHL